MKADIDTIANELARIEELADKAMDAISRDKGASPVLVAIVEEFHGKAKKARDDSEEAEEEPIREHIVELEQAGDCAKVAARADQGIGQGTREAILAAHEAICALKSDTGEGF